MSKKIIGKNWVTDKNITTGLKHTNKRTKAKEPEGKGGKKDRHNDRNTQDNDNKATIQCIRQNENHKLAFNDTFLKIY